MVKLFRFRHELGLGWLAILIGVLSVSGCAMPELLRGERMRELEEGWSEGFRPLSKPGRATGLTTKGRQVERNLGIQ